MQRLCCLKDGDQPSETSPTSLDSVLRDDGYTVGRAEQALRFRKIDPEHLDLAKVEDKLLNPLDYVAYPYNVLFSTEYLEKCMVDTPPETRGHRSLNLAP